MSTYVITAFNNGQITLAFDGRQVNFPLPVVDGAYPTGSTLTNLLDTYVSNAQAAAAAVPVIATNTSVIASMVATPSSAQLGDAIKLQRDQLLRTTDFTVIPGAPFTSVQITAWETYRQALRDLPSVTGFPTAFAWPVPPVILTNARGLPMVNTDGSPTFPMRVIW